MNYFNTFFNIIKEICEEEKIEYNIISNNWIMVLTKNNVTKCLWGYRFPLNDHAIGLIMDDKYAFYDYCILKKIPVIEHKILWNPNSFLGINTLETIHEYFKKYNEEVVIKPNNGTEGDGVYHITSKEDLDKYSRELFQNNFSISICPFYNIENEYRVVVLDGVVKLIFEKVKPVVIGNGKSSISDLLKELNPYYFNKIKFDNSYNRVLKENEIFQYDWRFNLSKGAIARIINDKELIKKLSDYAIDASHKLNLKFVSIDIVNINNKLKLMEVNSGVCINKACNFIDKDYKITKEIYRDAIKKMFQ